MAVKSGGTLNVKKAVDWAMAQRVKAVIRCHQRAEVASVRKLV